MALSSPLTPMVVPEPSWLQLAAEDKRALAELLAEEPGEAVGALEAADKVREEARKTKKKKETQQSVQEAEQAADRSEANLRKYRADETMKTLRKRAEKKADDTKKEEAAARKLKKQKERANHRQKQFRDTRRKKMGNEAYLEEQRAARKKNRKKRKAEKEAAKEAQKKKTAKEAAKKIAAWTARLARGQFARRTVLSKFISPSMPSMPRFQAPAASAICRAAVRAIPWNSMWQSSTTSRTAAAEASRCTSATGLASMHRRTWEAWPHPATIPDPQPAHDESAPARRTALCAAYCARATRAILAGKRSLAHVRAAARRGIIS